MAPKHCWLTACDPGSMSRSTVSATGQTHEEAGEGQWNILCAQTDILQDCMTILRCEVFPWVKRDLCPKVTRKVGVCYHIGHQSLMQFQNYIPNYGIYYLHNGLSHSVDRRNYLASLFIFSAQTQA